MWSLQKQNTDEHRIARQGIRKEIIYEAGVKKENGIFSREKRGEREAWKARPSHAPLDRARATSFTSWPRRLMKLESKEYRKQGRLIEKGFGMFIIRVLFFV